MILDSLKNSNTYSSLHPLFGKAFEFLRNTDLSKLDPGEFVISEGIKGIVMQKLGVSRAESIARFECHQQNIDIQLCIDGKEEMGWKPKISCRDPLAAYDPEKDVQFFRDQPDMFFNLNAGQFAIFFPEDVHAPMISESLITKIVLKIRA